MDGGKPFGVRQVKAPQHRAGSAAVRVVFWNALGLGVALLVALVVGEIYLRAAWPFARNQDRTEFVPGVGMRLMPQAEVRWTNTLDFWTVQRANSLGFLDREPPSPERATASCHVAIIGDSFVEAKEVPVSDKVQVRLERMAAERLPGWDVTVAAYGRGGTGQVAQLPWWDEWIRHRPPKLVVLSFVWNDYTDNGLWTSGVGDPPYAHVRMVQDGSLELILPGDRVSVPRSGLPFVNRILGSVPVALRPYSKVWAQWRHWVWRKKMSSVFPSLKRPRPVLTKEKVAATAFALDQWKMRVESGPRSARLVVLATDSMHRSSRNRAALEVLKELAAERDIPVIDQVTHILDRGGDPGDVHFANDGHWSPQGHQWAAEALLEWMAANPSVCDR